MKMFVAILILSAFICATADRRSPQEKLAELMVKMKEEDRASELRLRKMSESLKRLNNTIEELGL